MKKSSKIYFLMFGIESLLALTQFCNDNIALCLIFLSAALVFLVCGILFSKKKFKKERK